MPGEPNFIGLPGAINSLALQPHYILLYPAASTPPDNPLHTEKSGGKKEAKEMKGGTWPGRGSDMRQQNIQGENCDVN